MSKIIASKEELLGNEEFQKALKIVAPRLRAYLTDTVLLDIAQDSRLTFTDKGQRLEATSDILGAIMDLWHEAPEEQKQRYPQRPALRNTQFGKDQ